MAGRREGDSFEESGLLNISGPPSRPKMETRYDHPEPYRQKEVYNDEEPRSRGFLHITHLALTAILWLVGLAVAILGSIILYDIRTKGIKMISYFGHLQNASILVIVIGVSILIIGFVGCISAQMRRRSLLLVVSALLACLIILEIAACILAWYYKKGQNLEIRLSSTIDRVISQYGSSRAVYDERDDWNFNRNALTQIERSMKCCGAHGFGDYRNRGVQVPPSCYSTDYYSAAYFSQQGCVEVLQDFLFSYGLALGLLCIGALLLEVALIGTSCVLAAQANEEEEPPQRTPYKAPPARRQASRTPSPRTPSTPQPHAYPQPQHEDV